MNWEEVKKKSVIRLYAGDIPCWREGDNSIIGLSLTEDDERNVKHDITKPFPLNDGSVVSFQAESVFEYIKYEKLVGVVDEIYRVLQIGGLLRISVPDYGCSVTQRRIIKYKDSRSLREIWSPKIDSVRLLLNRTKFNKQGTIEYLHYYNLDGSFVMKKIDHSKGMVKRTPNFDDRVKDPPRPLTLVVDLIKGVQ